jgi:N-acetylmuramoyl-L-alanine amidase
LLNRTHRIVITSFLLLISLLPFLAAESLLADFIEERNLDLHWDELTARGILYRGTEMVSFMLDFPLISHNLEQAIPVEPLYFAAAGLMLPDSTRQRLEAIFPDTADSDFRQVSKIFIDPGHGGRDPGTIGRLGDGSQIFEKDIVLQIALDLAERLRAEYPEKEIILSRDSDVYLTLEERTELANSLTSGPDEKIVFVSIHANAALDRRARGIEVWYLPPEYRRQVLDEDDVDDESRTVLPILNSILEEEYTVESILLAQSIDRGMMGELGGFTQSRGLKEMDWYVVRKAYMPSVLVEVGFVTNSDEVELLNNPLYLQKISQGIYNGLTDFIQDFESVSR